MSPVKYFYESLSVEQKWTFSVGISGDHKEVRETIVKIIQLLQNQNFDDDIR